MCNCFVSKLALDTFHSLLTFFRNADLGRRELRGVFQGVDVRRPHRDRALLPRRTRLQDILPLQGQYRVLHQLVDSGLVDLNLGSSAILPISSAISAGIPSARAELCR